MAKKQTAGTPAQEAYAEKLRKQYGVKTIYLVGSAYWYTEKSLAQKRAAETKEAILELGAKVADSDDASGNDDDADNKDAK